MIIQEALKLGAYDMKTYANRNLAIAFGIASVMMLLLLLGGNTLSGAGSEDEGEVFTTGPVTLQDFEELDEPPEVTEETPPIEAVAPPPPPAAAPEADLGTGSEGRMGDITLTTDVVDGPKVADMDEVSFADNLGGGDGGAETFEPDFEIDEDIDLKAKEDAIIAPEPDVYPDFIPNGQTAKYSDADLQKNAVYPEIAKDAGLEGKVSIMVYLSKFGKIDRMETVKGNKVFINSARNAIKKTTFTPATQNGHAIKSKLIVTVKYKLK